jgi:hypothetical protein
VTVTSGTKTSSARKTLWVGVLWISVIAGSVSLPGCRDSTPALVATLTFKNDGSHFTGTVIRREPDSITVSSPAGDTHTFLYSELADIKYGASAEASAPQVAATGGPAATSSAGSAGQSVTADATIQLPVGTVLPITNTGLLDSSFVPVGAISLAMTDADVKAANGKVLIPAGANVTIRVRDKVVTGGRLQMIFDVGSVDFGNRHYLVSSVKGGLEPGAVATVSGAQHGSLEARDRGENVHLDDHSLIVFKTETPTVLKASQ